MVSVVKGLVEAGEVFCLIFDRTVELLLSNMLACVEMESLADVVTGVLVSYFAEVLSTMMVVEASTVGIVVGLMAGVNVNASAAVMTAFEFFTSVP